MIKFKIGDKVRYVKAGPIGWESVDWAKDAGLQLGEEYTISRIHRGRTPFIRIKEDELDYNLHPDHFELVEENKHE